MMIKRAVALASLIGVCAVSAASMDYRDEIISQAELDRLVYNLPEGVEIERIPSKLGFCGETADVVMDRYGYQIWCGAYTFMAPSLRGNGCFGHTLERRIMLTDIIEEWTDVDCDGAIELYNPGDGNYVSYFDFIIFRMIEDMGMQAEGDIAENMERFIEAANMYSLLLIDMEKEKARELWEAYKARHSPGGQE